MNEQFKRWNIPRGTTISESPNGEFYHCADFDTLAQRLQEAEKKLAWLDQFVVSAESEATGKLVFISIKGALSECLDAAMATKVGKGDKA